SLSPHYSVAMLKQYLLTPGPTPVPERVMLAMAQPMVHHRMPAFIAIFDEAAKGLKWIFQTTQPVLMLAGSGTLAMEASVVNTVVDAVSALGAFDLPMDRAGFDVLLTGSQKALMLPPGQAYIALSDKAWARTETADLPRFYADLKREKKAQAGGETAWTPAI